MSRRYQKDIRIPCPARCELRGTGKAVLGYAMVRLRTSTTPKVTTWEGTCPLCGRVLRLTVTRRDPALERAQSEARREALESTIAGLG